MKPKTPPPPAPPLTGWKAPFSPTKTAAAIPDRAFVATASPRLVSKLDGYVRQLDRPNPNQTERAIRRTELKLLIARYFIQQWELGTLIQQKQLAAQYAAQLDALAEDGQPLTEEARVRMVRKLIEELRSFGVYVITVRPKGAKVDQRAGYRLPLNLDELRRYVKSDSQAARSSVRTNTEKLMSVCSVFPELSAEQAELEEYLVHLDSYAPSTE